MSISNPNKHIEQNNKFNNNDLNRNNTQNIFQKENDLHNELNFSYPYYSQKKSIKIISQFSFKQRIRNWLIIFIIGLILEMIYREKFYDLGIIIIKKIQSYINDNIFAIYFFQILSFCASKYFLISLIILIFNYIDTYSSLLIIIISSCAALGTGFFKLIYKNPRPYFHENWVKVYDCETGFGNPSGHSIVAVCVYLTIAKLIKKKIDFSKKRKRYFNIATVILIQLITFSRLALGAHSLNQIIFGSFIGAMIYALFFDVFKMDLNLAQEIFVMMKPQILNIFLTISITILSFGVIIFNFIPLLNDDDAHYWRRSITENCPNTPYSKLFDYEAYFMLAGSSSLIGSYLGINFEIKYNLNGNIQLWFIQNFGNTNWNKTNFIDSIIRLIIIGIFLLPIFSLNFIVSSNDTINNIFFLKNLIPNFVVSFMLYGLTRRVLFYFDIGINRIYKIKDIKTD